MGDIRETGCKVGKKEVEVSTSEVTDVFTEELSKWFMLEAGFGSTINLLQQVKQWRPPFPFPHDNFVLAQQPGQHARFLWPKARLGLLGWECIHCFAHLVVILLLINRNQIYSLCLSLAMTFREPEPIPSPRRSILINKSMRLSHFPDITLVEIQGQ